MPVETPSLFARVIQDHLELKRRNAELERRCRSTATASTIRSTTTPVQDRGAGPARGDHGRRRAGRVARAARSPGPARRPSSTPSAPRRSSARTAASGRSPRLRLGRLSRFDSRLVRERGSVTPRREPSLARGIAPTQHLSRYREATAPSNGRNYVLRKVFLSRDRRPRRRRACSGARGEGTAYRRV